jgi:hypothetical protein
MAEPTPPNTLTAYRLYETPMRLEPAPATRAWMDDTPRRFAYRCLPLVLANQAGWILRGGPPVVATWDGGPDPENVRVEVDEPDDHDPSVVSHFGSGILTWRLPLLFRTSPGYNLLVRGAPNEWKDGACPLDGLVETDWSPMTFTMNWRITRPDHPVAFGPEDAICMIVPQRRGELEAFAARVMPLGADAPLEQAHQRWAESRKAFIDGPRTAEAQFHYQRGTSPGGDSAPEHQLRLRLAAFTDESPAATRTP